MVFLICFPAAAQAREKYAAIVIDTATGKVLHQANADARRYPASLTKMMTLYILFEELQKNRITLDSRFSISARAAAQPPSKLGLRAGQSISVEDAIKALVTKSANDVAVVLAENISGSVPAFAERMTRTARALGMRGTRFRNPHGLPDAGQYTTARDMATLGLALQVHFPQYYSYFKTRSFTYKGRAHSNHNKLLGRIEGVDGIKTGYTRASGFNLVSSVKRGDRKIIAVVLGGASGRARDNRMAELIAAYIPKAASRKGYHEALVAGIGAQPSLPRVSPPARMLVTEHPLPRSRPLYAVVEAVQDPEAPPSLASASEVPVLPPVQPEMHASAETRLVRTISLPVPPPAIEEEPSSAAIAFADSIEPVQLASNDESAALAAIIENRMAQAYFQEDTGTEEEGSVNLEQQTLPQTPPHRTLSSGWLIQIGALDSESAANKLLRQAREKGGRLLKSAQPVTESHVKNGQTFIRARFAGFSDRNAADRACQTLKKQKFSCFTLRL